jgi:hypothetical protein
MIVDEGMLRGLRDKYREIKRLRDEDAAGLTHDPKPEMAELARRFPGALRECDELPMEEIERRLAALEDALAQRAAPPQWVALQIGYHGWMRAALRIKRLAAGRRADQAATVLNELAQHYRAEPDEPPLAAFDEPSLRAILEPSEGRLNPWVYARVAEQHGVEPDQVRRALFLR